MIFLVRHGETDANAARVLQTPEVPLSARGLQQAERLALRLAQRGVGRILSSDLRRAAMTAECVGARSGAPLELEPLLQERNFGDLRGTPYAELPSDPFAPGYLPPGGESWEAFDARVDRAWEIVRDTERRTPGHLLVVTHGLVCRSLLRRHVELPGAAPDRFDNTSLTILEGAPVYRSGLVNCTAHLGDPASIEGGLA